MSGLSAAELLDVWERGLAKSPAQRALSLLETAATDVRRETLSSLSIGQRDARLLALRESVFGSQLASTAQCPACGERLEMTLNTADLRIAEASEVLEMFEVRVAEHLVRCRLPNSTDLRAIEAQADVASARESLLALCLISAEANGVPVPVAQLSEAVLEEVIARLGEADPQAVIELALACPQCHTQWSALFDIAAYFWTEIHAWARRLLREVHLLASTYGWSEAEIVGMSAARRGMYLEMISA